MRFYYRAKHRKTGNEVVNFLEAPRRETAVQMVQGMGLFPLEVRPETVQESVVNRLKDNLEQTGLFGPKIKHMDLAWLSSQMATMLKGGVDLYQALTILRERVASKVLRERLAAITGSLRGGTSLGMALAEHSDVFPENFIAMVASGEEGGHLEMVLEKASSYYEKQGELYKKGGNAVIGPAITLGLTIVFVVLMITLVIPIYSEMLTDMVMSDAQKPLPRTKLVMEIADFIKDMRIPFLFLFFGSILGGLYSLTLAPVRHAIGRMALKLPMFGKLITDTAVSRFCLSLGTLLGTGVPLSSALDTAGRATGNLALQKAVMKSKEYAIEGKGFSIGLKESGLFPPEVVQMISVAEEKGNLDETLIVAASHYEKEVNANMDRFITFVQSSLTALSGIVVAVIVLSTVLVLSEIYGALGG